jgi:uncharacterized protein
VDVVKLEHTFAVPADLDTVWAAVLDPERVAPCMPGASLSEVDGDTFKGTVKVKVGPISLQYKGSGEFLEKDEAARKVVIKASGKDTRGNGTAAATVTVTLRADGEKTAGTVDTDLAITGKPAQFGRGLISEVGGKILDSFAACLASKLAPEKAQASTESPKLSVVPKSAPEPAGEKRAVKKPAKPAAKQATQRAEAAATGAAAGRATAKATSPVAESEPAKPRLAPVAPPAERSESEPIDLLAYAGPSVAKRVVPLVVGLLVLLAVFRLLRRRG